MIIFKFMTVIFLFNAFSTFANICGRTEQVQDAIVQAVGKTRCSEITDEDLWWFIDRRFIWPKDNKFKKR